MDGDREAKLEGTVCSWPRDVNAGITLSCVAPVRELILPHLQCAVIRAQANGTTKSCALPTALERVNINEEGMLALLTLALEGAGYPRQGLLCESLALALH